MLLLQTCCLCFSPRTGTVVLGCLGILAAVLAMVPHVLVLQHHEFYIGEFIKQQRSMEARDIHDEDIPAITYFSQMTWSLAVAYDVIFTFASILLITGVAAERRYLLVPWLVLSSLTLVFNLVMVLAGMFSVANSFAVVILIIAAPFLLTGLYFWLTVYSAFHQMRQDLIQPLASAAAAVPTTTTTVSTSSSTTAAGGTGRRGGNNHHRQHRHHYQSLNCEQPSLCTTTSVDADEMMMMEEEEEIMKVKVVSKSGSVASSGMSAATAAALATPPPPYEAVAIDIGKEEAAIAAGIGQDDLTLFGKQPRSKSAGDLAGEARGTTTTEGEGATVVTMKRSSSDVSKISSSISDSAVASSACSTTAAVATEEEEDNVVVQESNPLADPPEVVVIVTPTG